MSGVRNSKKIITCKIFITCSISRVVMWLQAVFSEGSAYLTNENADFGGYGDDSRIGKPG